MQHNGKPPPGMKLFPRNLTARADYVVRGNPVVSRPESGADNCHPGLEFDQRNLDRQFFPGLVFDFQFGAGARLSEVRSPWREKTEKDGRRCLDTAEGKLFLWYVHGTFGDQPDKTRLADLYGLDGYEVLRKVRDLEPGPLVIAVGRPPADLNVDNAATWIKAAGQVKDRLEKMMAGERGDPIETFRDSSGKLQFAILVGLRADYLDEQGVIEVPTFEAGVLTQSLCSPWQWDFTDCGCFYWAASRPDIVTDADGRKGLNFLRADRKQVPSAEAVAEWGKWMEGTMSGPQMIVGWETLPVVVGDKEANRYEHTGLPELWNPWNRKTIIEWLRYLASLEHALCVKFLYAHYSVKASPAAAHVPIEAGDSGLTKVAKEIFDIAIDEMRHFRWVNEALCMLGEKPELSRATQLRKPPGATYQQEPLDLGLEALTHAEVKRIIEIERPSRQYNEKQISGLYTHILVSLERHPERYAEYRKDERERLQEICKLIIDEGNDHWHRAEQMQARLLERTEVEYLRFTGPPIRQPPQSDCGKLQALGDQYYQLMLAILGHAFEQQPEARGRPIRQARRVMHNLHEIGHLLGNRGHGLLFAMPPPAEPGSAVSRALAASIPNLLAALRELASKELAEVAGRHEQTASEVRQVLANDDDDEP